MCRRERAMEVKKIKEEMEKKQKKGGKWTDTLTEENKQAVNADVTLV